MINVGDKYCKDEIVYEVVRIQPGRLEQLYEMRSKKENG